VTVTPLYSRDDLIARVHELAPWYQNIDLGGGIRTKEVEGVDEIFAGTDIPRPLWEMVAGDLPSLEGKSVLDIGCNAGYMSIAAKRLGAARVVGTDNNQGTGNGKSFIDQARFCAGVLGLDIDFRVGSFFDVEEQFDVVLFCGVLYHLEDWSAAFDKLRRLCTPGGLIVLETEIGPRTEVFPVDKAYNGDTSTYFVPSPRMLDLLVIEHGLTPWISRRLGSRVLMQLQG
jgi:tRNA (mo5U34)-methyltransferase